MGEGEGYDYSREAYEEAENKIKEAKDQINQDAPADVLNVAADNRDSAQAEKDRLHKLAGDEAYAAEKRYKILQTREQKAIQNLADFKKETLGMDESRKKMREIITDEDWNRMKENALENVSEFGWKYALPNLAEMKIFDPVRYNNEIKISDVKWQILEEFVTFNKWNNTNELPEIRAVKIIKPEFFEAKFKKNNFEEMIHDLWSEWNRHGKGHIGAVKQFINDAYYLKNVDPVGFQEQICENPEFVNNVWPEILEALKKAKSDVKSGVTLYYQPSKFASLVGMAQAVKPKNSPDLELDEDVWDRVRQELKPTGKQLFYSAFATVNLCSDLKFGESEEADEKQEEKGTAEDIENVEESIRQLVSEGNYEEIYKKIDQEYADWLRMYRSLNPNEKNSPPPSKEKILRFFKDIDPGALKTADNKSEKDGMKEEEITQENLRELVTEEDWNKKKEYILGQIQSGNFVLYGLDTLAQLKTLDPARCEAEIQISEELLQNVFKSMPDPKTNFSGYLSNLRDLKIVSPGFFEKNFHEPIEVLITEAIMRWKGRESIANFLESISAIKSIDPKRFHQLTGSSGSDIIAAQIWPAVSNEIERLRGIGNSLTRPEEYVQLLDNAQSIKPENAPDLVLDEEVWEKAKSKLRDTRNNLSFNALDVINARSRLKLAGKGEANKSKEDIKDINESKGDKEDKADEVKEEVEKQYGKWLELYQKCNPNAPIPDKERILGFFENNRALFNFEKGGNRENTESKDIKEQVTNKYWGEAKNKAFKLIQSGDHFSAYLALGLLAEMKTLDPVRFDKDIILDDDQWQKLTRGDVIANPTLHDLPVLSRLKIINKVIPETHFEKMGKLMLPEIWNEWRRGHNIMNFFVEMCDLKDLDPKAFQQNVASDSEYSKHLWPQILAEINTIRLDRYMEPDQFIYTLGMAQQIKPADAPDIVLDEDTLNKAKIKLDSSMTIPLNAFALANALSVLKIEKK